MAIQEHAYYGSFGYHVTNFFAVRPTAFYWLRMGSWISVAVVVQAVYSRWLIWVHKTMQIVAVQEHAYYGSFGYHVTNFFAARSPLRRQGKVSILLNLKYRELYASFLDC